MQETVRNSNETKSLFSSYLEVLEAREKQAAADRELQEERFRHRTQRIYEFHDRQRREAVELRRCLDYVSQHAHVLESVLRGANSGEGSSVPLGASLVRQASTLQRCMSQCVANAARIRQLIAAAHRPQVDSILAKMEAELSTWTSFLQRAVDAACNSEVVIDNVHNLIAEQRRYVREVSNSSVFTALCGADADSGAEGEAGDEADALTSPVERRVASSAACSTPITRD